MKVAVLADIHANLAALEAVTEHIERWQPNATLVAGDIVNRGPRARECWAFVQQRMAQAGWLVLRGNHERYIFEVLNKIETRIGLYDAINDGVRWTLHNLGDVRALQALPERLSIDTAGGERRRVHASMGRDRDDLKPYHPDDELRLKIAPAPAVFCCGHTHRSLIRRVDQTLVVNAGSVGASFDGDMRAAYAQIVYDGQGWQAEIMRVPYDYERTARDFELSGYMREAGVCAPIVYKEFQTSRPYLGSWYRRYNDLVLAGKLTAAESVQRFLHNDSMAG